MWHTAPILSDLAYIIILEKLCLPRTHWNHMQAFSALEKLHFRGGKKFRLRAETERERRVFGNVTGKQQNFKMTMIIIKMQQY